MKTIRVPLSCCQVLNLPVRTAKRRLRRTRHSHDLRLPQQRFSTITVTKHGRLVSRTCRILSGHSHHHRCSDRFLTGTCDISAPTTPTPDHASLNMDPSLKRTALQSLTARPDTNSIPDATVGVRTSRFSKTLLLLLRLNRCRRIVRLNQPCLDDNAHDLSSKRLNSPTVIRTSIILSLALTYLRLNQRR